MRRSWSLLALLLVVSLVATPALAGMRSDTAGGAGGHATGIDDRIQGFLAGYGLAGAVFVLLAGMVLLTVSVEKLISYLTRAALGLRVSLFALAILFTGFEFDDTILAMVLSAGDLGRVALGTALGTGLAIVGVTLALAAIVRPFPVDLPTDYLALFWLSPVLLIPFTLLGTLTAVHGLLLVGAFLLMFGYVLVREFQRETPVFRGTELGAALQPDGGTALPAPVSPIPEDRYIAGRSTAGWLWIVLAAVTLVGIVVASLLLEAGSRAVIDGLGIGQTVFGATILTAILTVEDVMLTIEPVRRGVPEIGVGNAIGSVLFSLTGNVGVIMLFGDLSISRSVLVFHLPAVVVITSLAAYFLSTGRLKRWHGLLLGGLYVAYWIVAMVVFGGIPFGG